MNTRRKVEYITHTGDSSQKGSQSFTQLSLNEDTMAAHSPDEIMAHFN